MAGKTRVLRIGGGVPPFNAADRKDIAMSLSLLKDVLERHGGVQDPFGSMVLGKLMAVERILRDVLTDVADDR